MRLIPSRAHQENKIILLIMKSVYLAGLQAILGLILIIRPKKISGRSKMKIKQDFRIIFGIKMHLYNLLHKYSLIIKEDSFGYHVFTLSHILTIDTYDEGRK